MTKAFWFFLCVLLLVSCSRQPSPTSSNLPAVIIVTNPPTLTAEEAMPDLQTITPQNASMIQLLRTLRIPDYVRGRVSQCNTVFSPDGTLLLGVCGKNPVAIWDVQSGQLRYTLYPPGVQIVTCAFSPDGKTIACGGFDSKITLWNSADGSMQREFATISGPVWDLAFSPDGLSLASCGLDEGVRLWDMESADVIWGTGYGNGCLSLSFSKDGNQIAYGSLQGIIEVLDASSGGNIATLSDSGEHVGDIAFSGDGRWLVAGRDDDLTYIWQITDPSAPYGYTAMKPLQGHYHYVNGVSFNAESSLLITSSHDTTTHIIDTSSMMVVKVIGGHSDVVLRSCFDPTGKLIATISWDGTVKLWGIRL